MKLQLRLSKILNNSLLLIFGLFVFSCTLKPDIEAVKSQLSPYKTPSITSISPAQLFTGGETTVTITGENLGVGVEVRIGSKSCPVQLYGDGTSLTCTAPAYAEGSYAVEVSTPDGKTASSGITYDEYAFTKLSLVVGTLLYDGDLFVNETDGTFNQGACFGSEFLFEHDNMLYAAESYKSRMRSVNVNTLSSQTILPTNLSDGTIQVQTTDPVTPFAPVTLNELLEGFSCLTKDGDKIYFCPNNYSLMSLDLTAPTSPAKLLAGYTYYENDPFADLDSYAPTDPRGYNKLNHNIVAAFPRGNDLILVLEQVILKITNFDSTAPTMSIIAGDDVDEGLVDGNNTAARFEDIQNAVLIGDNLYVIDGSFFYSYYGIRKIDLADPNFPVTTVAGDLTNPSLPDNEFAADGTGTGTHINSSSSMIAHNGKIIFTDEYTDNDVFRIRLFDPNTNSISTIANLTTHNLDVNVLGPISSKAKLKRYIVYGIYYLEQWGLAISTKWGLLRLN